ncbi:hypothetical protein B0H19DRAFT_1100684 [Mycena capillaripes]|nr:hypothetical protein B0H19DRAFT_1100684 [Mycena capillaripes]
MSANGDFFLKFHSSFTANLFRFVPTTFETKREIISELNHTPVYLIARPSVRYTDLASLWERIDICLLLRRRGHLGRRALGLPSRETMQSRSFAGRRSSAVRRHRPVFAGHTGS